MPILFKTEYGQNCNINSSTKAIQKKFHLVQKKMKWLSAFIFIKI